MSVIRVGNNADEFMAGLQTIWAAHHLPNGATPFVRNVDFSRNPGSIAKRKGQAIYITSNGSGNITGLFEYIKSDGTKTLFASASDGNIYTAVQPGTWTSVMTGAGTDNVEFATFTNICIAVNKNISPKKSTGSTFTNLLGLPPANGKFVILYKNRLFIANTSAGKSRLHFSAEGNAEDWTTVGNAGFIDVNSDDGDEITGLAVCGSNLFIFKKFSIHILTGFKPDNFVVSATPAFEGCISHRSIKNMGTFLVYLSSRPAICTIAPGGFTSEISTNIRGSVEAIPAAALLGAAAAKLRYQYWLAFDSNQDGKNDQAFVMDFNTNAWSQYDNIKGQVFTTLQNQTLLSGGSDLKIIRQHDTTEDDETTPITMRWRSKEFDATGSFTDIKTIEDIMIHAEVLTGKTLNMKIYIDGRDALDNIVFSLNPLVANDLSVIQYVKGLQVEQGRHVQIEISNAEANAPVIFQGFEISCDDIPHQFWGPGPNSAGNPSGSSALSGDTYAATFIVASDPLDGQYTTIADAIANLPDGGGRIYVKQGTFSLTATNTLVANKPIEICGGGDSTIIDLGSSAIDAFTIPDGFTGKTHLKFRNFKVTGGNLASQNFLKYNDSLGNAEVHIEHVNMSGLEAVVNIADGSFDGTTPGQDDVKIHMTRCRIRPNTIDTSIILKNTDAGFNYTKVWMNEVQFEGDNIFAVPGGGRTEPLWGTICDDNYFGDIYCDGCEFSLGGTTENDFGIIQAVNTQFWNNDPDQPWIQYVTQGSSTGGLGSNLQGCTLHRIKITSFDNASYTNNQLDACSFVTWEPTTFQGNQFMSTVSPYPDDGTGNPYIIEQFATGTVISNNVWANFDAVPTGVVGGTQASMIEVFAETTITGNDFTDVDPPAVVGIIEVFNSNCVFIGNRFPFVPTSGPPMKDWNGSNYFYGNSQLFWDTSGPILGPVGDGLEDGKGSGNVIEGIRSWNGSGSVGGTATNNIVVDYHNPIGLIQTHGYFKNTGANNISVVEEYVTATEGTFTRTQTVTAGNTINLDPLDLTALDSGSPHYQVVRYRVKISGTTISWLQYFAAAGGVYHY